MEAATDATLILRIWIRMERDRMMRIGRKRIAKSTGPKKKAAAAIQSATWASLTSQGKRSRVSP